MKDVIMFRRPMRRMLCWIALTGLMSVGLAFAQDSADQGTTGKADQPVSVSPTTPEATFTNTAPPAAPVAAPPAALPIELVPYKVRLEILLDLGEGTTHSSRQQLRERVAGLLSGQVGQLWQIDIPTEQETLFAHARDAERAVDTDFASFQSQPLDKVLLVTVSNHGTEWTLSAREWDNATRTLSLLQSRSTSDEHDVAGQAVECIRDAFRPLAIVEQTKEGAVTLRGKGTLVPPHDESWFPLKPETVFEPYYRYLNKERVAEKVQRIPWTYLISGEYQDDVGRAPATPVSGLRTAISARRRRIEAVALGVPVSSNATRVKLATRPPLNRSIIGVEVQIRAERIAPQPVEGQAVAPPLARFVTDRRGEFTIPGGVVPAGRPAWLFVYSGSQMLGRVPFMPGIRPKETLELADDTLRLQVEGDIALLQARLVDLAAQRAVLMAQARKKAEDKEFDAANEFIKRVEDFVKPAQLLADLNTVRSPALKTAREQRDRSTEARIKKICDDTTEIINVHFGAERVSELKEEISELKEVADDEAQGIEPAPRTKKKTSTKKKAPAKNPETTPTAPEPTTTPPAKSDEAGFGT